MAPPSRAVPVRKDAINIEDDDDIKIPVRLQEVLDLTDENVDVFDRTVFPEVTPQHLPSYFRQLASAVTPCELVVRPGMDVELVDQEFLRIVRIIQFNGDTFLEGLLLVRTRDMKRFLERKINELCVVIGCTTEEENPRLDSSLVHRPISKVITEREIVFTNMKFPALRFQPRPELYDGRTPRKTLIEDQERLVVRWKFVEWTTRKDGNVLSGACMLLTESEADQDRSVSDLVKKYRFRGQEGLSAHDRTSRSQANPTNIVDLTSATPTIRTISRKDPYTFADVCCGGGGMSLGAKRAGLSHEWVLDNDARACATFRRNFPSVTILEMDISDFLTTDFVDFNSQVDILHISFPCQPWSAAHTCRGKNDDKNIAALFSAGDLLDKIRPRVVTFEETNGLLRRHVLYFTVLVRLITSKGYNVRWKELDCSRYGNSHARKRLFLIASCPGEPLPPFPDPTHIGPGLKAPVTMADACAKARRNIDPKMLQFTPKDPPLPRRDPHQPLDLAITCSGDNIHFSGARTFMLSELACLAGFPPTYQFEGPMGEIRKQIGNAVPSMVARAIFQTIIKSMEAADRKAESWKPKVISLVD